jgi:hypothetical protein
MEPILAKERRRAQPNETAIPKDRGLTLCPGRIFTIHISRFTGQVFSSRILGLASLNWSLDNLSSRKMHLAAHHEH